jgi:hypothetical protein
MSQRKQSLKLFLRSQKRLRDRLLLIAKTSPISIIPALIAWMSSPIPGTKTTTDTSAVFTISTSSWPTPTVSTITLSKPAASRIATASTVARERPPRLPRVAIERIKTFLSRPSVAIRMRSPRIAPPENRTRRIYTNYADPFATVLYNGVQVYRQAMTFRLREHR